MAGWCFRRGRDKATARERGFSEQWKKDLKTKRPSQKTNPLFFEQREQTVPDRREPIILQRECPPESMPVSAICDCRNEWKQSTAGSGSRQRMERAENVESGSGHWLNRADT